MHLERKKKSSKTTISLQQLVIFLLLFFLFVVTVIFIYNQLGAMDPALGRRQRAGNSGLLSYLLPSRGNKSMAEITKQDVKNVAASLSKVLRNSTVIEEKFSEIVTKYKNNQNLSSPSKAIVALLDNSAKGVPSDDLELLGAITTVLGMVL